MIFQPDCDDDSIYLIGRLELAKRERGWKEANMYELQLLLKDPKTRTEMAKTWGCSLLEAEKFYHELKFRKKMFRELRSLSKENKQKTMDTQAFMEGKKDG